MSLCIVSRFFQFNVVSHVLSHTLFLTFLWDMKGMKKNKVNSVVDLEHKTLKDNLSKL